MNSITTIPQSKAQQRMAINASRKGTHLTQLNEISRSNPHLFCRSSVKRRIARPVLWKTLL